jgi:hypothetical protein
MRCSKCGVENRETAKFCGECAAPLASKCPRCGATNLPGAKFCDECAAALTSPATLNQPAQPVRVRADYAEASAHEGERKTVTALFADIKGSMDLTEDLDPENARAIIDPALKVMIDAVPVKKNRRTLLMNRAKLWRSPPDLFKWASEVVGRDTT